MKKMILTIVVAMLASGGVFAQSAKAPERFSAVSLGMTELETFQIRVENAKSIEVLVDYEMVTLTCHGPSFVYSVATSNNSTTAFVEKRPLMHMAMKCPPTTKPPVKVQTGVKFTVKPIGNLTTIRQTVIAPPDTKIEYIVNR